GETRASVSAGERLAVNIGGLEVDEIRRGDILASPGAFTVTRRFDATIENASSRAIKHGARVRVYQGASELMGRLTLGAEETGPLAALEPGRRAFARVRLEAPAVLTRGDRFVLRSFSPLATLGGGVVL